MKKNLRLILSLLAVAVLFFLAWLVEKTEGTQSMAVTVLQKGAVYALIADAESRVHGRPVSEIHFHEVGTLDAVADVVGVCLLMEMTGAEKITASPVHVGSGYVRCMHGVLPVPAPATALILDMLLPTPSICLPTAVAFSPNFATLIPKFISPFGMYIRDARAIGNRRCAGFSTPVPVPRSPSLPRSAPAACPCRCHPCWNGR